MSAGRTWVRKNIPPDVSTVSGKPTGPSAILRVQLDDEGDRHVSIFTDGSYTLWSLAFRERNDAIAWGCWEEVK